MNQSNQDIRWEQRFSNFRKALGQPKITDFVMVFGLKGEVIEKIQGVFNSHPEIEQVILYGSRAKGEFRGSSDIDLTIRGDHLSESLLARVGLELDDLLLPYLIDLSIYSSINNPELIKHIERVGKDFYIK